MRKITSLPAQTLRLADRGVLAENKLADVVAFDPERFTDAATYLDPQRYAQGVEYVVVSGELAVDRGAPTDAMSGRVVHG